MPTPRDLTDHQTLFYGLCRELKAACRKKNGGFKSSVSVAFLLNLECQYALAETYMMSVVSARKYFGEEVSKS